jgi:uncharacterized membrane protein
MNRTKMKEGQNRSSCSAYRANAIRCKSIRKRASYVGRSRSLLKAVTWRCLGTFATILILFFMTGSWSMSLNFGIVTFFVHIFLYYGHERVWQRIKWGNNE